MKPIHSKNLLGIVGFMIVTLVVSFPGIALAAESLEQRVATLEAATKVSVPLLNAGDNAPIHESTPGSCLHCSAGRHRHFHSPETGEYDGWVARGSGRETLGLDLSQHGEKAYND